MDLSIFIDKIEQAAKTRSIALPHAPWVCAMTWRDLFFLSWPVPVEAVRAAVPPELELDTFDGSAWVTMVPMRVTDLHYRGMPPISGTDSFRELNLRTYVKVNGKPGIFLLSIDCPAAVMDWISSHFFGLPYLQAQLVVIEEDGCFRFAAERTQAGKPPAAVWGSFRPTGEGFSPVPGSLDSFLVERYASFFVHNGTIYCGNIQHSEWTIQSAEANLEYNSVPAAAGITLPLKPFHAGYAASIGCLVWLPSKD